MNSADRQHEDPLARVDHLVLATPDLDATVSELADLLGVRAAIGGQHPGRGTRNALIGLSPRSYLEIVAADPRQSAPPTPRWFNVDSVARATLVTWAATSDDLARDRANAATHGAWLGPVLPGRRALPDGRELAWQFTDPAELVAGGIIPFLIDWGDSPHPASTAPKGPRLTGLRAFHPEPELLRSPLQAMNLSLDIQQASSPRLVATFETSRGRVELS